MCLLLLIVSWQSRAQSDSLWQVSADTVVFISKKSFNAQKISLSNRDFKRLPGGFDDPARILLHFPGIAIANDQANGILYHGLPSHLNAWRLNGLDIVNPNHLSNAGTLSDLASPSAGGVNMFSGNILDGMQFIAPSSPGKSGWALGGMADMQISTQRQNYLQLSLLGLEAGLHKVWKDNTRVFANYRYSFTGLLDDLGVSFGNEAIRFDDLMVGVSGQHKSFHSTLLVAAGRSNNQHTAGEPPYLNYKDGQNIGYTSQNITTQWLGRQEFKGGYKMDFGLSFSQRNDHRSANGLVNFQDGSVYSVSDSFENTQEKFSVKSSLLTPKGWRWEVRYMFDHYASELSVENIRPKNIDQQNSSVLLSLNKSFYLFSNIKLHNNLSLSHIQDFNILPTVNLEYFKGIHSVSASFSRNASYAIRPENIDLSDIIGLNYMLDYKITAHRFRSSISLFYHSFSKLPADSLHYNYLHGFDYTFVENLSNEGRGKSQGISIALEWDAGKNWWLNFNHSLLNTKYKNNSFEDWQNAENDFGWVGNVNVGKTLTLKRGLLSIAVSCHYRGGQYYFGIYPNNYLAIRNFDSPPIGQFDHYLRCDARINYTRGKSMFSLDIQNLTNRLNDGYLRPGPNGPFNEAQLGLIPVISYKRFW